jgi:hypothetical protein
MARSWDFKGTQEYKDPSRCLGPFGEPGPRVGDVEGGLEVCRWVVENEAKCCRSASRIAGSKKGAGRGVMISVLVRRERREEHESGRLPTGGPSAPVVATEAAAPVLTPGGSRRAERQMPEWGGGIDQNPLFAFEVFE